MFFLNIVLTKLLTKYIALCSVNETIQQNMWIFTWILLIFAIKNANTHFCLIAVHGPGKEARKDTNFAVWNRKEGRGWSDQVVCMIEPLARNTNIVSYKPNFRSSCSAYCVFCLQLGGVVWTVCLFSRLFDFHLSFPAKSSQSSDEKWQRLLVDSDKETVQLLKVPTQKNFFSS